MSRRRRSLAVELGALAVVLALEGVVFARGLETAPDFDEGVYLAAVDAFRHGQALGSEIFTAQPPGFYWLLTVGDFLFGHSLAGVRHWILALALVGSVGAYLVGRAVGGPVAGLGAALLLGISPPYPTYASRISADLPGLAVGLLALAALVHAVEAPARRRPALAAVAGVLLAAAVSVKLSALLLLVPMAAYGSRRLALADAAAFLSGAFLLALGVVLGGLGGLSDIWRGAVSYHGAARDVPGPGVSQNVDQVLTFFHWKTPLFWLLLAALAIWVTGAARVRLPLWPLWLFAVAAAAALVWHRPLHDNHGVLLAVPLGLVAGTTLGSAAAERHARVLAAASAVAILAAAAGYAKEVRRLERNQSATPAELRWAAAVLRDRTGPSDLVASDLPIVAFLADRRLPGELVDTAVLRFGSGYLTPQEVLAVLRRPQVRAAVVGRAFKLEPDVLSGIERRFPVRLRRGDVSVYLMPDAASG